MSPQRACHWLLAFVVALPATAAAETQTSPPVFGAGITVVTLPVFVTDKDGKPIPGLTAADFEVQDEGKSVKILGVEEIDAGAPLPAFRAVGARGALAARRQFLLLFDLSFTNVAGLVRSRDAAKRFVREQLLENDLAAVATFSVGGGVRMLVGFTPDRVQLQAAMDDLGAVKQERRSDPLGLVYDLRATGPQLAAQERRSDMTEELLSQAIQQDRAQESDYRRRVEVLMKSMVQLGQSLDAIQGRKQVIYLSAGFDSNLLVGAQGKQGFTDSQAVIEGRLWDVSTERYGDSSVRDAMSGVFKSLASSDTVVHTIDVTGLATNVDAASQGDAKVAVGAGRESLSWIAADTGGRFYKDMNDLAAPLGEIVDATRRYYVLAFEPEALKGAGKFHKLRVQVKGRGQKVSHRTGYTESSPELTATLDREQTAEAVAKGLTGGPIAIEALAFPYRNSDGRVSVPVIVEVDGKTLLDRGPGAALPLEVFGYAFDEKGQVQDIVALISTLDLPKFEKKLRESGLVVQASFNLPPGRHNLRFVVRDGEKQRRGFHALDVTVPAFTERLLYPPLFMDDPARWLVVQASSRSGAPVEIPLRVGDDAFTPRMNASLTNGRSDNVCVMTFDGGRSYDPGAQFQIGAQLINSEGVAVRIGKIALTKSVAETDGFRRFVLNVTPAAVPPGEYTFKVKLTDPGTGAVSEAIHPVRVE